MKKSALYTGIAIIVVSVAAHGYAGMQKLPSNKHLNIGLGLITSDFPVSQARSRFFISTFNYEYCFMNPTDRFRTSIELGLYGFNALLPVPLLGADLYLGSEENDIQVKVGLNGFYDLSVGGHAGLMVKPGVVVNNRFDIALFMVPVGTDATRSYKEFLKMETSQEAEKNYMKNGNRFVVLPYYGVMFTIRI
jgi:hypothetical protein